MTHKLSAWNYNARFSLFVATKTDSGEGEIKWKNENERKRRDLGRRTQFRREMENEDKAYLILLLSIILDTRNKDYYIHIKHSKL